MCTAIEILQECKQDSTHNGTYMIIKNKSQTSVAVEITIWLSNVCVVEVKGVGVVGGGGVIIHRLSPSDQYCGRWHHPTKM